MLQLETYYCTICNRKLKPSISPKTERIELVCRYCNISVDPLKMKSNTKLSELIKESQEKAEDKLNREKYKHSIVPEKCPECDSINIIASDNDYEWKCIDCEIYFDWRRYRVAFHGDITVDAEDMEIAEEKAWDKIKEVDFDILMVGEDE